MNTTFTLRYRLSTNPESIKLREFNSEKEALVAALDLHYSHLRKPFKYYDISINGVGFSVSEATNQLLAWDRAEQEFLDTLPF